MMAPTLLYCNISLSLLLAISMPREVTSAQARDAGGVGSEREGAGSAREGGRGGRRTAEGRREGEAAGTTAAAATRTAGSRYSFPSTEKDIRSPSVRLSVPYHIVSALHFHDMSEFPFEIDHSV
jgi:hypothetical protein